MLFKKRISQNDFSILIFQIGYDRYSFLKKQFNNQIEFKDSLLFSVTEILSAMLIKRIYYYKNININFDIVESVNKFVYNSYTNEEFKFNYLQYYLYLKEELWNIIKSDDTDMIYKLSDYFISEITDGVNNDFVPRNYISKLITNWYFESKKIINNFVIK